MEKAKEKPPEFFKSIKTSLKSVLKHPELNTKIINDAVVKSNKIVIHTLQFLKLYLLDYYENNNQTLPIVSKELINNSKKEYDFVFYDTPAAIPYTDACVLGSKLDGVIMSIEMETTGSKVIDRALMILKEAKVNVLGTILTKAKYHIPDFIYKLL